MLERVTSSLHISESKAQGQLPLRPRRIRFETVVHPSHRPHALFKRLIPRGRHRYEPPVAADTV
jgi:hypothetical protein